MRTVRRVRTFDRPAQALSGRTPTRDAAAAVRTEVARYKGEGFSAVQEDDGLVVYHTGPGLDPPASALAPRTGTADTRSAAMKAGDVIRRGFDAETANNRSIATKNREFWATRGGR
jgi:hypothetical protein